MAAGVRSWRPGAGALNCRLRGGTGVAPRPTTPRWGSPAPSLGGLWVGPCSGPVLRFKVCLGPPLVRVWSEGQFKAALFPPGQQAPSFHGFHRGPGPSVWPFPMVWLPLPQPPSLMRSANMYSRNVGGGAASLVWITIAVNICLAPGASTVRQGRARGLFLGSCKEMLSWVDL